MTEHPLALTGERTLPGVSVENYWFRRHEVTYRQALPLCAGRVVVDAGCGEGYGTALLAEVADRLVGVELVADVVAHARAAYPSVEFVQADLCDLPITSTTVDVVVSLQVIEHLPDVARYLSEMRRILRPGGRFLCATPNRLTFTPDSDTPVNPFHVKEFSAGELTGLLGRVFAVEEVRGVHHGRALRAIEAQRGDTFSNLQLARPPQQWPAWLHEAVAAVTVDDFVVTIDDVDASLDLLAVCTATG
jgi:SAM-dependent methyltransferase